MGVDDIASSNTVVYEADFTFIGEWKFIQKRRELGIDSPRASVDGSKVILHVEHYDHLFKSLDMQADDEPQYPYPVYDSSSSEFESILSSKEWVSDVNNEHL